MPIGKNAIKRVENNGYSKVTSTAPDMINSTVISGTSKEVINMVEELVKQPNDVEVKTETEVKAEVKKPAVKKATTKKSTKKVKEISKISCGEELPFYLL